MGGLRHHERSRHRVHGFNVESQGSIERGPWSRSSIRKQSPCLRGGGSATVSPVVQCSELPSRPRLELPTMKVVAAESKSGESLV